MPAIILFKRHMGRNMHIEKFWQWVRETFTVDYQREVEQYLSQATDLYDLEERMRVLARRGMV